MLPADFFREIIVSLAMGALVGIERERHFTGTKEFAGIRTFAFVTLFGTLCAMFAETYGPWIVLLGLLGVTFLSGLAYLQSYKVRKSIGLTTEVVFIITYLLGVMLHTMGPELAIALSIIITLLLTFKQYTERISKELRDVELTDALKFAILAFIILPILPNTTIDPLNVINPYQLWILVILISGISFFGYFLMKVFGTGKGIMLTSALGGIASSTAVAVVLSSEVKKDPEVTDTATVGVIIASTIMFFRILLLVFILNTALVPYLLLPFLLMGIVGAAVSWLMMNGKASFDHPLSLTSPFSILPALKFAAFFAFILVISHLGNLYFGNAGLYAASFLSGLVDADAIVLSMPPLLLQGVPYKVAALSVLIAAITNTFVKAGITFLFGSRKFGIQVLKVLIPVSLVGLAVAFLL